MTVALAILRRVPVWAWVLVLVLAWGGWQRHVAKVQGAKAAAAIASSAAKDKAAADAALADLDRQVKIQKEATNAEHHAAERDRAAAAFAVDALRRLRVRLATSHPGPAPTASAGGPTAQAGPDVCPELLGRLGEAAGRLAEIADARGRAGTACERISEVTSNP